MKKLVSVIVAFALMMSLAACGAAPSSSSTAAAPSEAPSSVSEAPASEAKVIGMSMNALDDYQTEWLGYFTSYAESLGYTLVTTNAEGKVDKQLADIESLIAQKPAVIVIRATDSEGVVPAFEMCEKAGIPTLDSGFGSKYENTLKILSSQIYLCSLQANFCDEWLKANPDKKMKVGYLWGVQGVSAVKDRYDGWKDTLMKLQPDRVEILAEKVCNWSAVEAMAAVEDWMQAYPEMNCIVAQSDELALAATNVLQAANVGTDKCIVVGIDGSANGRAALKDGTLSATVYTSRQADAKITADYAIKVANGEDLKGKTIDPGDSISALLTAENMDEVIAKLG